MEFDYNESLRVLTARFGINKALHINAVVIPNILKDFEKVLKKSPCFATVTEEYIFEGGGGKIVLTGTDGRVTKFEIK